MAFEPSWAADQLVVLYIPLLLASVAHKWSVFPFIRKGISIELLLLAWCGAILILTKSRVTLFGVLVFLLIAGAIVGIPRLRGWIKRMFDPPSKGFVSFEVAYAAAIFTLISSLAALAIGVVLVFKETDPRAANLFSAPKRLEEFQYFYPNEGVYELANELAFAERIVYWDFGFHTFSDHPMLGVGPGNAGFFFEQNLPPYGYGLTEIRNVLDLGEYGFPNPKNLWLRLLSETGILGFSIYVCWYVFIAASAFLLLKSGAVLEKVVALSGLMVVVIQLFEGFSLDTFALPQMWIVFGFVALVSSSRYQQTRNPAVDVRAVST
jgi:O-antigen ligase